MADLISRQAAIDAIDKSNFNEDEQDSIHRIIEAVPSIEPERKTGRWIFDHYVWKCSSCGGNPTYGMGYVQTNEELFKYCPHCGARMEIPND